MWVSLSVFGQRPLKKVNVRKVKKYKELTEIDLSGSVVKGKAKAPDIFYIFQRKRAVDRFFVKIPEHLLHHKVKTTKVLKETLRQ